MLMRNINQLPKISEELICRVLLQNILKKLTRRVFSWKISEDVLLCPREKRTALIFP